MDDCSGGRLVISGDEDWREVHELRAGCDAIMVGAATLRSDNPALVIRDPGLRKRRESCGMPADITKVTLSGSGNLDPALRFFTEGPGTRKIVLLGPRAPQDAEIRLSAIAEVVRLGEVTARKMVCALSEKGVGTLLVEGGAKLLKIFFDEGEWDEVRIAVSPRSLAELGKPCAESGRQAPRLPYFGGLPFENAVPKHTRRVGEMTVTRYLNHRGLFAEDRRLLQSAIDISRKCEPSDTSYCVGCVLLTAAGEMFEGYTHETGRLNHAEEEAIMKACNAGADLAGATIYTSMEPCSKRASKPVSCSELIINHRMRRVVYALAEPDCFVHCDSARMLRKAGIEVVTDDSLAEQVRRINSHIIRRPRQE